MNKLGMHIHGIKPGIIQAMELLQPRTITIMDPSAQEIRDIYAVANPMAVVRKYEDGRNFQQVDPRWWAEEYYRMVGDAVSDRLVALGMNEPFGHDAKPLCAPFDEWNRAFIERCRELGPMDGGALAMATGNWTGADDRYRITDDFPGTSEIARFFLLHEYCWPTLEVGVPWHTLRYRAWIGDLEAIGRDDFFFILSEAGLTQAIIAGRPDHGYRSGGPEGVTEDSYISTISWYNARLCEDWRVLGCCLYDWAGSHYGWETFEQLGLEQRIYQIQAPEPPEPPEPPNGGEPMQVRIFDRDGNEKDEAWMRLTYGVTWRRHGAAPSQQVYRLMELREKTGNSSLITKVVNEDGNPMANVDVAFYWSKAPDPPDPPTTVSSHDWYRNFVHGPTNVNGDVGPGMGTGAYHGPGDCGPHKVWVRDPSTPSDICECLGMVAGTFHDHMDQKFMLTDAEIEPPEPPVDGDLLAAVLRLDANVAKMREILEEGYVPPDDPPDDPPPPPEKKTFTVQFFDGVDLSGPVVYEREEPLFEGNPFFWRDWGSQSPAPNVRADYWSARWTGVFTFEDRIYIFNIRVDDGARLLIDGIEVWESWKDQSATTYGVHVSMKAGLREIVVEYYERAGDAVLHFNWQ